MTAYRSIPGFPGYRAGDDGSIWSQRSRNGRGPFVGWRPLRPIINTRGYLTLSLCRDGAVKVVRVHRLVLLAFAGPCPPGMQSLHLNGGKLDNRAANLRYGTGKENAADSIRHGTAPQGEKHPAHKLKADQVKKIRSMIGRGLSHREIGLIFGVQKPTVTAIATGRHWKSVA